MASACALLIGGVLADKFPRKYVMIWADAVRIVAVGSIALLASDSSVLVLSALVYASGLAEAFFPAGAPGTGPIPGSPERAPARRGVDQPKHASRSTGRADARGAARRGVLT